MATVGDQVAALALIGEEGGVEEVTNVAVEAVGLSGALGTILLALVAGVGRVEIKT